MPSIAHLSFGIAAMAAAYFLAGHLSLLLVMVDEQVKLVWAPSGIALAALWRWGLRLWPGVLLGAAAIAAVHDFGTFAMLGFSLGSTVEAVLGAWLLLHAVRLNPGLERLRDAFGLALGGAVVAAAAATVLELSGLALDGAVRDPVALWWVCWLGRALGVLLVTPVLLAWGARPVDGWTPRAAAELALLSGLVVAVSALVFGSMAREHMVSPLPYTLFPLLLWAAVRFGPRETVSVMLVGAAFAVWGTANGNGPFMVGSRDQNMISLYLYLAVTSVAALALAAAIKERERAEEQSRQHLQQLAHVARISALGEMASAIAHEINQPLTAILSYTQASQRLLAAEQHDRQELQHAMERAAAQAQRAGEIIRRVRSFVAKEENETLAVDVNYLVTEVVGLARPEARQCGIQLRLDLTPDLPQVRADAIQIQQVVLNLVRNGLDAINSHGAEDRVLTVSTMVDADTMVVVTVRDSGPGVELETAQRIFDPFFTTKPNGMGIGLVISRSIAEVHGGSLTLVNPGGSGAEFRLALPRAASE